MIAFSGYISDMARPLRIEFAGALYHVTARGDRREPERSKRSKGTLPFFIVRVKGDATLFHRPGYQ
jgi:hypothetical protein